MSDHIVYATCPCIVQLNTPQSISNLTLFSNNESHLTRFNFTPLLTLGAISKGGLHQHRLTLTRD